MSPIEFHVLEHTMKMFKTSPKSTVSAKCGSEVSSKGPCDEGLVSGLRCYWEVVEPLEGGMRWKSCHQGYAFAGMLESFSFCLSLLPGCHAEFDASVKHLP